MFNFKFYMIVFNPMRLDLKFLSEDEATSKMINTGLELCSTAVFFSQSFRYSWASRPFQTLCNTITLTIVQNWVQNKIYLKRSEQWAEDGTQDRIKYQILIIQKAFEIITAHRKQSTNNIISSYI